MRLPLLVFALLLGVSAVSIKAESPEPARFAYVTEGLSPLSIRDLRLGYDFLIKRYAKNYNMAITMFYDNDGLAAAKEFQKGNVQYVGMSYILSAQLFSILEPSIGEVYISSQVENVHERLVTLVRKEAPDSLKPFQNKRAVLQEGASNSIMYADTLSMEMLRKRYHDSFKIDYTESSSRAILKLFFNQADIAFVPLRSWETAKTMNPSLEKELKILHTSPPIYGYGIELFSNQTSPRLQIISQKANDDLVRTEEGRQLLRIMKASKRIKVTKEELKIHLKPYFHYLEQVKAFKGNAK